MSQPKRCQSCGEPIGPSAKYCGGCGAEQIEQPTQAWYTQTWVAVVALWLFFPLGLYLMWRFQRWQVWVKTVVTVVGSLFAILIIVGAAVGGGEDDGGEAVRQEASPSPAVAASPSPTVEEPTPTTEPTSSPEATPTAEPTPTATPEPEFPEYRVVTVEDISFGPYEYAGGGATTGAVRYSVRAVTEFPITKAQAQAIMDKIIDEISSETPLNAMAVFLYDFDELSDGAFTLAKAEFAPDGDWAKADQVETGDYGRHQTVYEFQPKLDNPQEALADRPSEEEVKLCAAFDEAWLENPDASSDEKIADIAAQSVNASPQDILDASWKCVFWPTR